MSTPWAIDFEIKNEDLPESIEERTPGEPECICLSAPPSVHTAFHVVKDALIDCYDDEDGDGIPYAEIACGASNALVEFVLHLSANRTEADLVKRRFLTAINVTFKRVIKHMEEQGAFDEAPENSETD